MHSTFDPRMGIEMGSLSVKVFRSINLDFDAETVSDGIWKTL